MPGCEILEWNIQVDHIHLIMVIPPKYAVSDVIGEIKQYTASRMREKLAWLEEVYWKEQVMWSPSYFISSVGLDEKQIIECVRWGKGARIQVKRSLTCKVPRALPQGIHTCKKRNFRGGA